MPHEDLGFFFVLVTAAHNKKTKKASFFVHVFSSFVFVRSFSGTNQPDNQ